LFVWRKAARAGLLSLPPDEAPAFVPVVSVIDHESPVTCAAGDPGGITIEIAGAVVRAGKGIDPGWLRDVLRAVRAAA